MIRDKEIEYSGLRTIRKSRYMNYNAKHEYLSSTISVGRLQVLIEKRINTSDDMTCVCSPTRVLKYQQLFPVELLFRSQRSTLNSL